MTGQVYVFAFQLYTPNSTLKIRRINSLTAVIKDFSRYWTFLTAVVKRDIKRKYYRSSLGLLWTVLHPCLITAVFYVVFTMLFSGALPNFPIYLLTGQMLFQFNADATSVSLSAMSRNVGIINKINIPKYMFCISDITVSFINMLFTFIPLIVLVLISGVGISRLWFLIPGVLLLQVMFTLGLSLTLAAYGVFFKDLHHLYGIFVMMWMFLSAIFYPISIVDPQFMFIWEMNPMIHYITILRDIIWLGVLPQVSSVGVAFIYGALMLAFGCVVFNENQDRFFLYV